MCSSNSVDYKRRGRDKIRSRGWQWLWQWWLEYRRWKWGIWVELEVWGDMIINILNVWNKWRIFFKLQQVILRLWVQQTFSKSDIAKACWQRHNHSPTGVHFPHGLHFVPLKKLIFFLKCLLPPWRLFFLNVALNSSFRRNTCYFSKVQTVNLEVIYFLSLRISLPQ